MIKNIGFFINNFDHGNGTERCTQLIANGLSKHNYNVYIISLYHGESPCLEVDHKITLLSVHRELMGTRCFIKKNRIVKDVLTNFINIYNIELVVVVDVALYKYIYIVILKSLLGSILIVKLIVAFGPHCRKDWPFIMLIELLF